MNLKDLIESLPEISIPIGKVHPNNWNFNEQDQYQMASLKYSAETYGEIYPCIVRELNGGFEIIDGEHRWMVATSLGKPTIKAKNLGRIDDNTAKELMIILNESRGNPNQLKLAQVIRNIKIGNEELVLPYSNSYLEELKRIKPEPFTPRDFNIEEGTFEYLRKASSLCEKGNHDLKNFRGRKCKKCQMIEVIEREQ